MNVARLLALLLLPAAVFAADKVVKVDKSRSFIEADVDATKNFTTRLEKYEITLFTDGNGKIKNTVLAFKFTDLKSGDQARDDDMIKWLGGGEPEAKFESGMVALAPDGQGQATGRLTFHGATQMLEFPINVVKEGDTYTLTGEETIDYREWGLKVIRKMLVLTVNPQVKIRFKLVGTLSDAPAPAKN
jgi:polyisoprenoid-binding protein YceI